MSWKRRVRIGLGIVLAALLVAGLWFSRRMGIEEICPGVKLTECSRIEVRYKTWERSGPYFDDTRVVLSPGEPGFDEAIGLLAEKGFSRSPFWRFRSSRKSHRWMEGDFLWYMDLVFEDVTLPDGSTGSGYLVQLNNFFGDLELRRYDGNTYPVQTSGQREWIGEMMDIFLAAEPEDDSK